MQGKSWKAKKQLESLECEKDYWEFTGRGGGPEEIDINEVKLVLSLHPWSADTEYSCKGKW